MSCTLNTHPVPPISRIVSAPADHPISKHPEHQYPKGITSLCNTSLEKQAKVAEIHKSNNKITEWSLTAHQTGTNINAIKKDLEWSFKDILEVAKQTTQDPLVNLNRAQKVLQIHCCRIIQEITEHLIIKTLELAKERLNSSDPFQAFQFGEIGNHFLELNAKEIQGNVTHEEEKSKWIRNKFLFEISLLVNHIELYKTIWAKKTTLKYVKSIFAKLQELNGLKLKPSESLENAKNKIINKLNAVKITTTPLEKMLEKCSKAVIQTKSIARLHWLSGNCADSNVA